ncbi:DinB family protein [Bacillus sp. S/N-304-OC-R1]|uniref:DinB family protein n=1 Tax=Bacillus sp. S/N-304-OC-R1 TaxID=2758034 RepID=UPI001C8E907B|nr:DinB family protein [Bacillus sp. S/N-304-OC-R1]MBY0120894.1 DinB family protein [Bacillus sp. S/N-304-OC-R1]
MSFQEIKNHHTSFSEWIKSLKDIDQEDWQQPISEGKWSVGAVIAHLLFWDKYSLNERFPFFKEGAKLNSFPDFQRVNDDAEEYSKKVSKEQVIDELLSIRTQLLSILEQMKEEELNTSFYIGDHQLTIKDYFKDFIEHDLHHKEQVVQAIGAVR